jgi:hypothetical protein
LFLLASLNLPLIFFILFIFLTAFVVLHIYVFVCFVRCCQLIKLEANMKLHFDQGVYYGKQVWSGS